MPRGETHPITRPMWAEAILESPDGPRCRVCNRRVLFVVDENGKRQILDPSAPVYSLGDTEGKAHRAPGWVMVSHYATCKKVEEWKRLQAEKRRTT